MPKASGIVQRGQKIVNQGEGVSPETFLVIDSYRKELETRYEQNPGISTTLGGELLYVFLIVRIVLDADQCRESFTRIYGYCVAACIFMHLFINIGMTIGLMPVIGIPLPLLSYGGSSLWAFTVLIFIFIALYRQEKKYF